MNKKFLLLSLFLVAVLATVNVKQVNSNISFPPVGSCGDPTTNLSCAQSSCHNTANLHNAAPSDFTFNIGTSSPTTPVTSSFKYVAGTTYNIAFFPNLTANTNPFYGFQMVALDGSNASAGTFATTTNPSSTVFIPNNGAGPQYIGHKLATSFKNWVFKWTAPAASAGPVTFYYAFNVCAASVAQNPSMPEGDIYTGSVTIQPAGGVGINDIADKLSNLNIFPNPVSKEFGLSFNLKQTEEVSAQLYSLNGQLVSELMNEELNSGTCSKTFNVNGIAEGIYLVKLNVGEASVIKKIVKQQ